MQPFLLLILLEHETEMDMRYVCHVIPEIMKNVSGVQVGAITMAIREDQLTKLNKSLL